MLGDVCVNGFQMNSSSSPKISLHNQLRRFAICTKIVHFSGQQVKVGLATNVTAYFTEQQ